jgi:hypothetical protein
MLSSAQARKLATSADVYEALANRYRVCATAVNFMGSAEQRAAGAGVQAARCAVRTAVDDAGVRHASVLPALDALRAALAAPGADGAAEAARVAADAAFLRDPGATQDTADETWLASLLHVCLYLAPNDQAAAKSMLPRIAALSGRPAAELFWDLPARRLRVREPGGGAEVAAAVPAAARCARPGCPARGAKWCAACKRLRYCGPECQKVHWKAAHKQECGAACAASAAGAPAQVAPARNA